MCLGMEENNSNTTKNDQKNKFWNGVKFIKIEEKMVLQKLCDTTYKNQI